MQQRQPRLGDILDDYCPRERRLTNHVVVAMVGDTVKQTRCTTCEADHEYKHATLPRQRKKAEQSALYTQVLANVTPKKPVVPQAMATNVDAEPEPVAPAPAVETPAERVASRAESTRAEPVSAAEFEALFAPEPSEPPQNGEESPEEGPAHRRLIRAQLPRHEGQVSSTRQVPDFTIRQPANPRAKRFGGRNTRGGGAQPQANRPAGNHNGNTRGGAPRHGARPGGPRPGNQRHGGRNRSK
jgi:hypothetical protein